MALFTSAAPPKFQPTKGVITQSAEAVAGAAASAAAQMADVTKSLFNIRQTPA
jgi:hypothetical protein